MTTATQVKTAIISFNDASGKWEAIFEGMVICSGTYKEYVMRRIDQGAGQMVRASGVTAYIDASEMTAEQRAALIKSPSTESSNEVFEPSAPAITFGINERFEFVSDFVEMVGKRKNASALVIGTGGLGKSHTTLKALTEKCGLTQVDASDNVTTSNDGDEDDEKSPIDLTQTRLSAQKNTFLVVKGYTTAKGLFRTLYENRNRVIVFDDCDDVLKNDTAVNLLKAALDSYDRRMVTWNAESVFGDDLPRSFEFLGGVVIISNKNMNQIPQALVSRSLVADVSMTRAEAVDRMRVISSSEDFMPEFTAETKVRALNFMAKHINTKEVADPNMRTLMSVIKILSVDDANCERRALYTMCSPR